MKRPHKLARFWARISDGMALSQLWEQLRHDTRAGYQLYAQEAGERPLPPEQRSRGGRRRRRVREFLWAILLKLSPARRVILLAAIVLLLFWDSWGWLGVLLILAVLALEIADRVSMKRDLEIAREIQLWLLPTAAPTIPDAEVAFTNQPANTVSGDFYDAFYRGPESGDCEPRLLLTVADVAGKGVPAAMLTATFQASLRTLAAEALPLAGIALALNRYACVHSAGGMRFTTAFLAEYDPATRHLRYCNAGHNPPLLRRAGGAIEKLERGGVPFGILPEAGFECAEAELRAGDVLVVYSDGMTESFSEAGAEYGEERLIAALDQAIEQAISQTLDQAQPPALSAAALLEALVADCARFRNGARQQDDLTCLLLRVG